MQVFEIDGYDIASIVDVQDGGGFDPAPAFLEPLFGESAIGEGSPKLGENVRNREWVVPLHVAPDKLGFAASVDGLRECVIDLNRRLAAARQLRWKDEGASNSTYYDIVSAVFEPDYRHFRARQTWLSGTLRLVTRPYGHTGTTRIAGTAAGTGPLLQIPMPSVAGDAPAQLETVFGGAIVSDGSLNGLVMQPVYAAAVVPTTFDPVLSPSALTADGYASVVGATGGVASRAVRGLIHAPRPVARAHLSATSYEGEHRVLALLRSPASVALTAFLGLGLGASQSIGPTVTVAGGSAWNLVDLGAARLSPERAAPTAYLSIVGGRGTTVATQAVEITQVYLLPEQHTVFAVPDPQTMDIFALNATVAWSGVERLGIVDYHMNTARWRESLEAGTRGRVPHVPVGTACKAVVLATNQSPRAGVSMAAEVRVRERFTFAR